MENYNSNNPQQRDIILSPNEFIFVQSNTNGIVKTYTGPITITVSMQDTLVYFDKLTKKFIPTSDIEKAKQLMILPPENWYIILKNPTVDRTYPEAGKACVSPELNYGKKINVRGPASFALYPGQMAKVVKGHSLRSNQYLLARVYEAASANNSDGEMLDAEGNKIEVHHNYVNGQILVIKGTEVSFYIPPTGIEVIPIDNNDRKGYVREAITLERLEYCILKDEDGNKRYVHGPEVVFPKPTETFVASPKGGYIFRAIELSKISGIYIKVIAEYTEGNTVHPVGEELFITGDQQMIYYPRPEHAIISYDNKIMHHAIAIPAGEGRYIMNRLTGQITTIKGPAMYLPDPRTEVVVKRKLTPRECELMYPGNREALQYNLALNERAVEKSMKAIDLDEFTSYSCVTRDEVTMANLEAKANISRGTSYTKPRTITLDTKYEGVVTVDVWTGYAVNIISKSGDRKVVCGPQTILLDYDQTFEQLSLSTGKPKTTNKLIKTVFLRHENNKVSDIIEVETKDFVKCQVHVSYCVDFDMADKDKWFNIENYVKYMCDRERSLMKREAKKYTIEEFYNNYTDIIRNIAINIPTADCAVEGDRHVGRYFPENGMYVHDCEVLSINVEDSIANMLENHQYEMVKKSLALSNAEKRVVVAEKLAEAEKKEQEVRSEQLINKMNLEREEAIRKMAIETELNRTREAEKMAATKAQQDMQPILDAIHEAQLARDEKTIQVEIDKEVKIADIEKAKQTAYAETVEKIMASIEPGLIEALTSRANADIFNGISNGIAPYALANGESAAQFVDRLLRGTTLESIVDKIKK